LSSARDAMWLSAAAGTRARPCGRALVGEDWVNLPTRTASWGGEGGGAQRCQKRGGSVEMVAPPNRRYRYRIRSIRSMRAKRGRVKWRRSSRRRRWRRRNARRSRAGRCSVVSGKRRSERWHRARASSPLRRPERTNERRAHGRLARRAAPPEAWARRGRRICRRTSGSVAGRRHPRWQRVAHHPRAARCT
jgi:hypothetical protein